MGNYLKAESIAQAFTRLNEQNFDNKMASICCLLRILKKQGISKITANKSYKIKGPEISTFLDQVFSFTPKTYSSDQDIYLTFPKGYSSSIFKLLCKDNKFSAFDLFTVLNQFEELESVEESQLNELLAIPEDVFEEWFFIDTDQKPLLDSTVSSKSQIKKEIYKLISPDFSLSDFKNFSFSQNKKYNTVSNPGELKRGPFFQPLYGSFEILECVIVSSFDVAEKYQSSGNTGSSSNLVSTTKHEPKNIVFYGPPGTGKTRASMFLAYKLLTGSNDYQIEPEFLNLQKYPNRQEIDSIKLNVYATQFHPSYSYEDFFEGLRPIQVNNGEKQDVTYAVVPGTFKVVCDLARAYLVPGENSIKFMLNLKIKADGSYQWDTSDESIAALYRFKDRPGKILFENTPIIKTGNGFEDLKPESNLLPGHSGCFKCNWIYEGPTQEFIIFIDELNRGNPAKVFGEGLSLIETTKRIGTTKGEASKITLPYSHENFGVPNNLHIICSMNTADKSLTSLDQAFRRRFEFVYFPPLFEVVETDAYKAQFELNNLVSIRMHFELLNKALEEVGVSQESFFGQSYLINALRSAFLLKKNGMQEVDAIKKGLEKVWKNSLHPQIREMVGEENIETFATELNSLISKVEENKNFLSSQKDLITTLRDYLEDMRAPGDLFPWKIAS